MPNRGYQIASVKQIIRIINSHSEYSRADKLTKFGIIYIVHKMYYKSVKK